MFDSFGSFLDISEYARCRRKNLKNNQPINHDQPSIQTNKINLAPGEIIIIIALVLTAKVAALLWTQTSQLKHLSKASFLDKSGWIILDYAHYSGLLQLIMVMVFIFGAR